MKKLLIALFAIGCACAQSLVQSTTSTAYPGATVMVTVSASGFTGNNVAAVGFTAPAGASGMTNGAASVAASLTMYTSNSPMNALFVGMTNLGALGVITTGTYTDGVVSSYDYVVPATAALGSTVTLALTNPMAVTLLGAAVPLTANSLTLTVGISASCLTAIDANINGWLSTTSQTLMGKIEGELQSAHSTGTCQ